MATYYGNLMQILRKRTGMAALIGFDFEHFLAANAQKKASNLDYLQAIFSTQGLPADLIRAFALFFWPKFVVVDELVFVADLFSEKNYQNHLHDGKSKFVAQYWMNLTEIRGIFEALSMDEALSLAEVVANCWNANLNSEFARAAGRASVLIDPEMEEVFVVVGDGILNQTDDLGECYARVLRPNVKEFGKWRNPVDGTEFADRGRVRDPQPDEIPVGG